MPYGFVINVEGNAVEGMKKIADAIQRASDKVSAETEKINKNMNEMGENARKLGERLVEAFAIREIVRFGTELLHLTAEFEGFENVIKYASRNSYDAGQNLDYIADASRRLHLPIKEALQSFSEMEAGFYGTGIEGQKLRNVFEGVSTAATVLHLSADKFSNVTFALKEIGELGTLQARQMRMLAFAMPGAMNLAAQSMHMNTLQFHEAMKHGQINSSTFLPAFAAALQTHYAKGLPNAGNSLISQMNDTSNAFIKMKLVMGENLRPLFTSIMKDLQAIFNSGPVKLFIAHIADLIKWVIRAVEIWAIYKTIMIAIELVTKAYAMALKIVEIAQYTAAFGAEGFTVALGATKTALIETGVGAFAVALGLVIEKFIEMNAKTDEAVDKLSNLKSVTQGFDEIAKNYGRTQLAFGNLASLTPEEKSEMFSDIQRQIKTINDEVNTKTNPSLMNAQKAFNTMGMQRVLVENASGKGSHYELQPGAEKEKLGHQITDLTRTMADEYRKRNTLMNQLQVLTGMGIKPDKGGAGGEGGAAGNSLKTSHLAGAQGGLGEAKIIQIHIGVMQQNNGVKESRDHAQQALAILTRELNNIAYGSSSTQ